MNQIKDLQTFLEQNQLTPITVGRSGAEVYAAGENYILKRALCAQVNDETWASYVREVQMYTYFREINADFAPEAAYIGSSQEEINLLLARGTMLTRDVLHGQTISQIMDTLVRVHHTKIPGFLPKPSEYVPFSPEKINNCREGWRAVLAEHPGRFDDSLLDLAAEQITQINLAFAHPEPALTHGDFHCDNLLRMPDGSIRVCDWQSAGIGDPAGDLSFLHSRLAADGSELTLDTLIDAYCEAAKRAGFTADAQLLRKSAALANLNTSFEFWHMYLHGADETRVAGIYEKMVEDLHFLMK